MEGNKTAPRFSSFKPQAKEQPSTSQHTTTRPKLNHKDNQSSRGAGTEASTAYQSKPYATPVHRPQPQPSYKVPTERNRNFVVDLKGDPENAHYGSLHRYNVSRYRRSGGGSVLGASRWLKIDRDADATHVIELRPRSFVSNPRGLWSIASAVKAQKELKIKANAYQTADATTEEDFITISAPRVRKRKRSTLEDGGKTSQSDDEGNILAFRSTHGKAEADSEPADEDLEYAESKEGHESTAAQEPVSLKTDLTRRLKERPDDGQLWLELVSAQLPDLTNREVGRSLDISNSSIAGNAEVRMSMIDKALKTVKDDKSREELLMVYMAEAEKAWDSERVLDKWKDFIGKNQHYLGLRLQYFRFLETNFTLFRFNDVRDAAIEALAAWTHTRGNHHQDTNDFSLHCYLLLRITLCARQAGYGEMASAIWQANLEFNFRRKHRVKNASDETADVNTRLVDLEDFWESEDPRIGDYLEEAPEQYSIMKSQASAEVQSSIKSGALGLEKWSHVERIGDGNAELSVRATDDVDENDPYRVVLFSDVKPFVLAAKTTEDHQDIVNAFLVFCQLPPCTQGRDAAKWWQDAFLRDTCFHDILAQFQDTAESDGPKRQAASFQIDDTSLFTDPVSWYCAFVSAHPLNGRTSWYLRALSYLVELGVGTEQLAEYYLGLELHQDPSNARKAARRVLKRYPSSLRLYNAYVLIEMRVGKEGAAEAVLRTVLDANRERKDAIILWRTWIWSLIDSGSFDEALKRLLMLVDSDKLLLPESPVDAATVLQANNALAHATAGLLAVGDDEHAVYHIELCVLLEYLSSSDPLDAALASFTALRSKLPSSMQHTRSDEFLHQFRARLLLIHHTRSADFASIKTRDVLMDSIAAFPHNTLFPSLLLDLEPWSDANDRVRTIVSSLRAPDPNSERPLDQPTISSLLLTVRSELQRSVAGRSNAHAVRRVFENAVETDAGAHSPVLWQWYVAFECRGSDFKRARQVFYGALRACPWVKQLYLMAFDEMREGMSASELKGVYELMEDKELRIRMPLDELFAQVKG